MMYQPVLRQKAWGSATRVRMRRLELCFLSNAFHEIVTAVYKSADINICCPTKLKLWKCWPGGEEKPLKSITCC